MHHKELNDLSEVARLHAELLRAIATGDEQAAAAACERQIDYAAASPSASSPAASDARPGGAASCARFDDADISQI